MITGTVQTFDVDSGTGVLLGDDGKTYDLHHKDIASMTVGSSSFKVLRVGQRVMFDSQGLIVSGSGQSSRKAVNVKPMQGTI